MFLLELLDGLYSLYLILFAGPRAVLRWIRRISSPSATELAVSARPEMQRFRRNSWLLAAGWLALSLAFGIAGSSLWFVLVLILIGVMILPSQVEKRYDRLVAELSTAKAS